MQRFWETGRAIWHALAMDLTTIDWSRIEQLRALQKPGRPDVVRQLVTTYLANSRGLIASLDQALAEGNADVSVRAAHSLKSTTAAIGADALAQLAAQMEGDLRRGERSAVTGSLLQEFRIAHDFVVAALSERFLPPDSGN